ncbi:DinB family protein [Lichenifustis flavocetrariae]|uniref:DinB family protein n=1 Tax=Lichenifustis flavocetrariae TaxID=2949735 RepID=A0AA42CKD3_9HYPH|nr:DinB family protein [Lichenifustis flavocetrariae]MCW6509136.1 DinB family protein [Lichenifustis flavocetrariae]
MHNHFRMMAAYNAWANDRLYAAAAALSNVDYRADRGAFFKSVHGTFNHLLVTDRIWMRRFTEIGPQPIRLDEILFDDLAGLRPARDAEDRRIAAYVDTLQALDLDRVIRYTRASTPEPIEQRLAPALAHLFNHQTHHRGQVHAVLTGLTGKAPELDLLFFQRTPAGRSFG